MKLKTRLFYQSIVVLTCTVLITAGLSLVFGFFYTQANKIPVDTRAASTQVVILKNGVPVYQSGSFSKMEIQEMLMNFEMNKKTFQHGKMTYSMDVDEFKEPDSVKVIKLAPLLNADNFYGIMIFFVVTVFLITFLIASLLSKRHLQRLIVEPVTQLKKDTEILTGGDLDTPVIEAGEGEVAELCRAVEQLRLRLKESVYYQEKYDDNRKFLVSSISHDLRTPVTAVRGYLEGLRDGVADTPEKQTKYVSAAIGKTVQLTEMISDLLLYSKLDMNQIPFEFQRVEIAQYLEDCVADNQMTFDQDGKKITFTNELSHSRFVSIDASRFRRVAQNIIDNARKHTMPQAGAVRVSVREAGQSVIIEFSDNGAGISKDNLPHIFDRFYRADNARRTEGSSGLGLAIAKQIVEGQGGRIWATSEEGIGTKMMISLKKIKGENGGTKA